ncbi:MAG: HAMP domain-containing histidine kinase [Candidatus Obscuribacterales bacterium]|nr:HAMP domain-containing histidine kinase [Candidatus Obscuribacterales bacterium]
MNFRSVAGKGLVLIGLSCLIQLVSLQAFQRTIAASDQVLLFEAQEKSILAKINWLTAVAATLGLTAAEDKDSFTTEVSKESKVQLLDNARAIAEEIDPSDGARLLSAVNEIVKLTNTAKRIDSSAEHQLRTAYCNLASIRREIISKHRKGRSPDRDNLPDRRNSLQHVAILIVLANVMWVLIMATIFFLSVSKRVSRIISNVELFERGEQLPPPLTGHDEIAQLDRTFVSMAARLTEAQQRRQEIYTMVSHDLKTPLQNIVGIFDLIKTGAYGSAPQQVTAAVDRADKSVDRLLHLIQDFLDSERLESKSFAVHLVAFDIRLVLEQSVDMVKHLAEEKQLALMISAKLPTEKVLADPDRTVQIVVNLLSNAIKFSSKSGSIEVESFVDEVTHEIKVEVLDHGRGVADEHKESIFEKFVQVERCDSVEQKGTGLGLAISSVLVQKMGGTIGMVDTVGGGSTFWFRLPLCPPDVSVMQPPGGESAAP